MDKRELIESWVVIACGLVLLSPEFNTVIKIPYVDVLKGLHPEVISHLAIGLVPIILLYFIDMFIYNETD